MGCRLIDVSVQFSRSVVSDSFQPQGPEHARPPCPSPTPEVYPNSCPLSQWCHPTISSSVVPFSSWLQSFSASGSFPMSQLFASGSESIRVSASASVLPVSTQDWSPLGWTGWILLQIHRYAESGEIVLLDYHAMVAIQSNFLFLCWLVSACGNSLGEALPSAAVMFRVPQSLW